MRFPRVGLMSLGSFDDTLSAVQAQVPGAAEAFLAAYGGWVVRTAAAICRTLGVPERDHEDAVQETYRRLLDPRFKRFAPSRGSGKEYVRGVILNAIDFAGRRRRRAHEGSRATEVEEPSEVVDAKWKGPFDRAEERSDLPKLLRRAEDPLVSRAVALVCGDGLSQRDAAKVIGVSEFKLSRALRRFSALARLAA